jgi:hypothetical protein
MAKDLVAGVEARVDIGEQPFCSRHGAANEVDGELREPGAGSTRVAAEELVDCACGSPSSVAPALAVLEPMMRR